MWKRLPNGWNSCCKKPFSVLVVKDRRNPWRLHLQESPKHLSSLTRYPECWEILVASMKGRKERKPKQYGNASGGLFADRKSSWCSWIWNGWNFAFPGFPNMLQAMLPSLSHRFDPKQGNYKCRTSGEAENKGRWHFWCSKAIQWTASDAAGIYAHSGKSWGEVPPFRTRVQGMSLNWNFANLLKIWESLRFPNPNPFQVLGGCSSSWLKPALSFHSNFLSDRCQLSPSLQSPNPPESLINKIAAGEVVERPVTGFPRTVWKFLDAGATKSRYPEKRRQGFDQCWTTDPGWMDRRTARTWTPRHQQNFSWRGSFPNHTPGFRGEALAAISSVSRLELTTCSNESKGAVQFRLNGGVLEHQAKPDFQRNQNFWRSFFLYLCPAEVYEKYGHRTSAHSAVASKVALAAPSIQFRLTHNQQMLLNLPKPRSWGTDSTTVEKSSRRLMTVQHQPTSFHSKVGFPCPPRQKPAGDFNTCLSMDGMSNALRWITGFMTDTKVYWPRGNILHTLKVEVAPEDVDVNVHPAKRKFVFATANWYIILADQFSADSWDWKNDFSEGSGRRLVPQRSDQVNLTFWLLSLRNHFKTVRKKNPFDVRQRDLTGFAEIPVAPSRHFRKNCFYENLSFESKRSPHFFRTSQSESEKKNRIRTWIFRKNLISSPIWLKNETI